MLLRKTNGLDLQQGNEQQEEREHEVMQEHETELEATIEDLSDEITREQEPGTEIREQDEELEEIFSHLLEDLNHSTMLKLRPREKLCKLKLTPEIEESANRILDQYLHGDENIPEITEKVYAMGKAVAIKTGIVLKEKKAKEKQKPPNGNRRQRKLKAEMKKLRQQIARASNEIHRRTEKRKATTKERETTTTINW